MIFFKKVIIWPVYASASHAYSTFTWHLVRTVEIQAWTMDTRDATQSRPVFFWRPRTVEATEPLTAWHSRQRQRSRSHAPSQATHTTPHGCLRGRSDRQWPDLRSSAGRNIGPDRQYRRNILLSTAVPPLSTLHRSQVAWLVNSCLQNSNTVRKRAFGYVFLLGLPKRSTELNNGRLGSSDSRN